MEHVRTTILKPGVIYSSRERPWTLPVTCFLNAYRNNYDFIKSIVGNNDLLQNLEIEEPTPLEEVAIGCIVGTMSKYDGKRLFNKDLRRMRDEFENNLT